MSDTNKQDPIMSELVAEDPSFADLVEEFVGGLDERLRGMRAALDGEEIDTLKSLAHQLKGAGGGHGYPALTDVSGVLEQHAKDGALEECKASIEELAALLSRVVVGP